jgi:D-alanine-D-alanine ligase
MARVAVLTGGRSLERSVSLRSAARVERALRALGHEPAVVDVDADTVHRLLDEGHDAAFICAHGQGGEDGSLQELCEVIGLPYTGSGIATSIRCFDKVLLKHALGYLRVPTPPWVSFSQETLTGLGAADALPVVVERLGLPLIVKPARMGSALGIAVAHDADDLGDALVGALSYDSKAVVERFVAHARDFAVSLLGTDTPQALPAVEAVPRDREVYDFEARYTPGATEFTVPARLPPALSGRVRTVAQQAYAGMRVRGFGRVDMVLGEDGEVWVIDLPTIPGLTETSLLPMAADAAGIGFEELVGRILEPALDGAGGA